ncbi:hypothetical protein VB715_07000 [Crocosphaera sp. UHCC 0190]|uniref:hypothetical protein n=1 Tax=unclassified Crocosphaera TaxID=2623705 RepID=UPI002B2138C8|nr:MULTISPECIES: hypothetical protein [unclassified Crocosphaera]MEA5509507.1 hypothetical protein [Crocosphaera sp. UHCC 0190]MEA5534764.1 hypothetical protein [Crocosphaera sp. XPORK-15E]
MILKPAIRDLRPDIDNLKNFQRWKAINGEDFSPWDYLFRASRAEVAIILATLFCPEFIEYDGGIFLAEAFDQAIYQQWKQQLGNDIKAIEKVMNHQHIDDLFSGSNRVGINNLCYLGQAIRQMWENHLKLVYPHLRFVVCCEHDEDTVTVTFYQSYF